MDNMPRDRFGRTEQIELLPHLARPTADKRAAGCPARPRAWQAHLSPRRQFTATAARTREGDPHDTQTLAPQSPCTLPHPRTPRSAAHSASARHGRLQQRHRQRLHKLLARLGMSTASLSACTCGCCCLSSHWLLHSITRDSPQRCDPVNTGYVQPCSPPEHRQQAP